jgi:hypothetical protein
LDFTLTLCWGIGWLLLGFLLGSFFLNYYPTIWLDEECIYLSFFLLFRIRIPWHEVIDITEREWFLDRAMLVKVKKFLPFHIQYSLIYSGSLYPGFLIKRSIQNSDELIRVIRLKALSNKRKIL